MADMFPEPVVMSAEEAQGHLDRASRHWLRCSGDEFLRRWDAGQYRSTDSAAIAELAALVRFVRHG